MTSLCRHSGKFARGKCVQNLTTDVFLTSSSWRPCPGSIPLSSWLRPGSYNKFMVKRGFVYIMGSHKLTLYTRVTNNLIRRVYEHKHNLIPGFTDRYKCHNYFTTKLLISLSRPLFEKNKLKTLIE